MQIDAKNLKEIHVGNVPLVADDERFYAIQNARKYACSNYGRLYRKTVKDRYNKVPMLYVNGNEAYSILFDNAKAEKIISIRKLLAMVFYPSDRGIYLYCGNWNPFDAKRWNVEKLDVLRGKDEIMEAILSKMEHRSPSYKDFNTNNGFLNQPQSKERINKVLHQKYWNMRSRATNIKVKQRQPQYQDTTISNEWLNNPESFYSWYMEHTYYYPGNLSVDKDILSFGTTNKYSAEYVAIVPIYINNIFTGDSRSRLGYSIQEKERADGTKYFLLPATAYRFKGETLKQVACDTYTEALRAGRNRKADYIRKVIADEREKGYMPEYILDAMEKWANRCELGLVKLWEPSEETLEEMGVI